MAVRIQQHTVEQAKTMMQRFLPHFLEYDLGLDQSEEGEVWDYKAFFGLYNFHFAFKNITYEMPVLDIRDTKIDFTRHFDRPMIKVAFPGLRSWKIEADLELDTFFNKMRKIWSVTGDGEIVFDLEDLFVQFNTEFGVTEKGFLKPILYATELNWGNSKFYHESWALSILFDQWIKLGMIIVKNSIYFMGNEIFTDFAEPTLTNLMNQYQLPLDLPDFFPGQNAHGKFFLDMRHVSNVNPYIGEEFMDMYFLGETIFAGENCKDTIVDNSLHFKRGNDHTQFVIGESALTCMAIQWANSPLGKLALTESKFNKLFGTKGIKTDSTSIKSHIKIFEDKLGKNIDLDFVIDFKNIDLMIG